MTSSAMNPSPLIERLSQLLAAERRQAASALALQPVQLDILEYLSRCNRYSDSPAAVTEYFGLTKGTVSQSIARLVDKGLVEKHSDPDDARRVRLALSAQGSDVLAAASGDLFREAVQTFDPDELAAFERVGRSLLRHLQERNGRAAFGLCRTCRFFETHDRSHRCGLTGEDLSVDDSTKLCREFEALPGDGET